MYEFSKDVAGFVYIVMYLLLKVVVQNDKLVHVVPMMIFGF